MSDAWLTAAPSVLVGIALLIVPGGVVIAAGWGWRSVTAWLFAPAVSIALIAGAATLASLVGLRWSLLPVLLVTLVAAAAAFLVRRWSTRDTSPESPWRDPVGPGGTARAAITAATGLLAATAIIAVQLAVVFGSPEHISQTFDNIVHLNAARLALDSGDASIFAVGRTSDIAFYPNGWHSIVTLVAQIGGGSIPLAVSAANIAVCAFAWPASALALSAAMFAARPAALAATAALATGFAAFPLMLLDFGVLYPNVSAYAFLPAGIAAVWLLIRSRGRDRLRSALLLVVVAAGVTMAHPNALLALVALSAGLVVWGLGRDAWTAGTRRAWVAFAGGTAGVLIMGIILWRFARTNAAMSGWASWQTMAQAFGEGLFASPDGHALTLPIAVLILVGLVRIVRSPARWLHVGIPFVVAVGLFVAASGVPAGTFLRDLLTNPWYNDSFRLAALLPLAAIPVAALGVLAVVDALAALWRRRAWPQPVRTGVTIAGLALLFAVAIGPNVTDMIRQAQTYYRLDATSPLLTVDERALLDRLDEATPEDALILANPWNGGSLAFAISGRDVHELHVFSARSEDEVYVDEHLAAIDSDPEVCAAVERIGATFVLDFGSQNVWNRPAAGTERAGLNDLPATDALRLVDEEGSARLYEIVGCAS